MIPCGFPDPSLLPDIAAVAWLFLAWFIVGWLTEHPPAERPSVSRLMAEYRREWMRQFVRRDTRIFDGNILANLRESTAFFASASMIAIGGGLALVGNADRISDLARQFGPDATPVIRWELKIIVALFFVIDAFLKFVWSNRLFGYCAIVMGSVPDDGDDPRALPRAMQAAEINIRAARSFNAGLRGVYFALGALAWLAGPVALAIATTAVACLTWRREFASGSRRVLLENGPVSARVLPGEAKGGQPGE